jgi:hypothetical protein
MRLYGKGLLYAACGLLAVGLPSTIFAQGGQQTARGDSTWTGVNPEPATSSIAIARQTNQSSASAIEETASAELPDSPGAVQSQAQNAQQAQAGTAQSQTPKSPQDSTAPPADPSAPSAQEESQPHRPVGTAAAEAPRVSGVTAAQPAGVAIAPAKQRRVRTLVIRVGVIAAASVALGTTIALTMGTSSKPPGAH